MIASITLSNQAPNYEECYPTKTAKIKEIKLYYWYLVFLKMNCINSWAKIAANIPNTSPTIIKNMFYSNAKTTLRKIAKSKYYFEDKEDRIRRAFYVYCTRKCLLDSLEGKRDYFQKLVLKGKFTYENVSKYASNININWSYETLLLEVEKIMSEKPTSNRIAAPLGKEISLPIKGDKTLPALNFNVLFSCPKLSFEEKNTLMYYLCFPRKDDEQETTIKFNLS